MKAKVRAVGLADSVCAATTFNTTGTLMLFGPDVSVMLDEYWPTAIFAPLAVTCSVAGVEPDVGLTVNQGVLAAGR